MNYKRITVSLPDYLYEDVLALVPTRGVSEYVAEAVEAKIMDIKMKPKIDPIDAFLNLRRVTTKISSKRIMEAIRKGRT